MSDLTLMILRIGFLLVLWVFIFAIVYALRSDLFGAPVRKLKGEAAPPQVQPMVPLTQAPIVATAPQAAADALTGAIGSPAPGVAPGMTGLPSAGGSGAAQSLVITSGVAAGTSIPLDDTIFTIGRSSESTLVIVDEYTSTYHARLARTGSEWILTDLDSTNGTKLDGAQVTNPVAVPLNTPVTIGATTFELRQ